MLGRWHVINAMAPLLIFFGLLTAIIWIVIGWRAMRAHERIAEQITRYVEFASSGDLHNLRRENAVQHKQYKQFILSNPEAEKMASKDRHDLFRDWLRSRGDAGVEE